jgi:hypothetical protein
MKKKELKRILYEPASSTIGDNVLIGLTVIQKYFPEKRIVRGCSDSTLCSVREKELRKAGLTEEDARILRDSGWDVSSHGVLCHEV